VKIDIDWEGSLNEGQFGISSDYRETQNCSGDDVVPKKVRHLRIPQFFLFLGYAV